MDEFFRPTPRRSVSPKMSPKLTQPTTTSWVKQETKASPLPTNALPDEPPGLSDDDGKNFKKIKKKSLKN